MSAAPRWAIHADAWAEPVDVPSLNRAASDLILQRVEEVRRAGASKDLALTSSSLLCLGPAGAGKTHLFTRLPRSAGRRAVFIHTRPQIAVEPTPRFVLRSIVESLKQPIAGDEERQIDLVAGAILAAHEGDRPRFPLTILDDVRRLSGDERRARFEQILEKVEDRFPEILPDFLLRLLSVPFAERQDKRALLTWLAGGEPSVVDLERLGAPGPLADVDVMSALRTLGIAAAYGAPVVLVFDQLENLAEDEGKTGRVHAHARLVSDLRDTVRGLTIVQMALEAEWMTRIHPALHASDRDRLEETVLRLARPTPDERRELLERWREALPDEDRAQPFPHPFPPAEVERWIHDRAMTPRMLMQACSEAWLARMSAGAPGEATAEPGLVADPDERLAAQWDEAVARARDEIDEAAQQGRGAPAERLAGGLLAAFGHLLGGRAELVSHPMGTLIRVAGAGHAVIAQQTNHRSLAATLRHATALPPASKRLLLRERALAIPPTWKEVERCLAAFTAAPGTSFVPIDRDDVARLLALEAFVTAARSHDLSADDGSPIPPEAALAWAARSLDAGAWGPIAAVLSSGAPAAAVDPGPAPAAPAPAAPATTQPMPAVQPAGHDGGDPQTPGPAGPGLAVLSRLRVASVERLLREARAFDRNLTRADLVTELRRAGERRGVRFFGESVVALAKGAP